MQNLYCRSAPAARRNIPRLPFKALSGALTYQESSQPTVATHAVSPASGSSEGLQRGCKRHQPLGQPPETPEGSDLNTKFATRCHSRILPYTKISSPNQYSNIIVISHCRTPYCNLNIAITQFIFIKNMNIIMLYVQLTFIPTISSMLSLGK